MPGEFTTFGGDGSTSPVPLDELAGQINAATDMVTAIISDGLSKLATYISQASQQLGKTTKAVRGAVKKQITKAAAPVNSAAGSLILQAQNRISEGQIAVESAGAAVRTASAEGGVSNASDISSGSTMASGIYTPPPGGSAPVVGMPGVFTDAQGLTYTKTASGASYWGAGTTYTSPTQPSTTEAVPVTMAGVAQITPDQQKEIQTWATDMQSKCPGILQMSTDPNVQGLDPGYYWTLVGSLPQYGVYAYCGTPVPTPGVTGTPIVTQGTATPPVSSGPQTINYQAGTVTSGCGTPPFFLMGPNSVGPYYAQPSSPTLPSGTVQSLLPGQIAGATAVWDSTGLLCGYIPGDSTLSGVSGGNGQSTQAPPAAPCELPPDVASWPGQRIVQLPYDLGQSGEASPFGECGTLMINDAVAQMLSVSDVIKAAMSDNPVAAFEAASKPLSMEDALYLGIEE